MGLACPLLVPSGAAEMSLTSIKNSCKEKLKKEVKT